MAEKLTTHIDARCLVGMISAGAANLKEHVKEINDLNVFPIPDGDTGDNMLMTIQGGANAISGVDGSLSDVAKKLKSGMLLSARGNSGVILSQFFAGIAGGFKGLDTADMMQVEEAFRGGVKKAYAAVMVPTEGTILTVAKDATEVACDARCRNVAEFLETFLEEARASLDRTPDLLAVLKEAGVVDSGGAGLICIVEGMYSFVTGKSVGEIAASADASHAPQAVNPDLFTEDMEMEFGYCTELLLRLQNSKCDVKNFDEALIKDYLETIGNSIVCVKSDSIVKIHVHTMTPYKVLEHCQKYGEYLTVKIENMMLQHSGVEAEKAEKEVKEEKPLKDFGLVTVASGDGIRDTFISLGADFVIPGGQTMNPSSQDFISSFDEVGAKTIFVLPNNSNIILAATQAAELYKKADVRIIPTKTVGDAYAVLTMLDYTSGNADEIEENMNFAMDGVITAEITKSIRDTSIGGVEVKKDDYIGVMKKDILASRENIADATKETLDKMNLAMYSLLIVITGKDADSAVTAEIEAYVREKYPLVETSVSEGGQEIYNYILVAE